MATKSISTILFPVVLLSPLMTACSSSGENSAFSQAKFFIGYNTTVKHKEVDHSVSKLMAIPKDEPTMASLLKHAQFHTSLQKLIDTTSRSSQDDLTMIYLGRCIQIMVPNQGTITENVVVHYGDGFYTLENGILKPIHISNIPDSLKRINHPAIIEFLANNKIVMGDKNKIGIVANDKNRFTTRGLIYGSKIKALRYVSNKPINTDIIPAFGLVSMTESIANISPGRALALPNL